MEEIKKGNFEEAINQQGEATPSPLVVAEVLAPAAPATEAVPAQPSYIGIEDFSKVELRVGQILTAEPVPKADKLLRLTLELGFEQRTVVSGIAQHYSPESIIGQRVLVLANLAPRKMRGIDSNGMILMAEENGKLVFVAPTDAIGDGRIVS